MTTSSFRPAIASYAPGLALPPPGYAPNHEPIAGISFAGLARSTGRPEAAASALPPPRYCTPTAAATPLMPARSARRDGWEVRLMAPHHATPRRDIPVIRP